MRPMTVPVLETVKSEVLEVPPAAVEDAILKIVLLVLP